MFTLKIENQRGERFTLSDNKNYNIIGIDGLASHSATINTSNTGLIDGTVFNSARANARNIVLTIGINPPVEQNRIALYQFFRVKQKCKIYYKNDHRNVYIEGYVETIENDLFTLGQRMQISIICPQPYFLALAKIASDVSKVVRNFEFPFAISKAGKEFSYIQKDYVANVINKGDADCGIVAVITAMGEVVDPIIYSASTGGSFGVNVTMSQSDQLIIDTNDGQKGVKFIHNGVSQNYINKIMKDPDWFTLSAGDNIFSYTATSGVENMSIYFEHQSKYQGV